MQRIKKSVIHPVLSQCHRNAPNLEHHGFIAYATVEVFHLEGAIWFVALYLSITGIMVWIGEKWGAAL